MDEPIRILRLYIFTVAMAAAALGAIARVVDPPRAAAAFAERPGIAVLLAGGVLLGGRFPLHLSYKTKVYTNTALLVAAAIVFPAPEAMLIAAAGTLIAELLPFQSWEQALFNTAQTALHVGAGSLLFHAIGDPGAFSPRPGVADVLAILAAGTAMLLLNSAAVAEIGAVQPRMDPVRSWLAGLWKDVPEHAAQVLCGVLIAALAVAARGDPPPAAVPQPPTNRKPREPVGRGFGLPVATPTG
ncbi:MAG: hypothetical protein AVDCRST_MAG73-302 [uncultured Thermomicrobiales bacterium]|uniref:MASE9 domain-containing protein n=1 Tax=uncultured Thermomicrobiales bacterium TaxID=1645740 RepID=A0A6J4THM9_9BACT|nr:MAG: hypothetical protein AVDCRST_MAG73-302 [uncultured Thermomicrobiales bacterium]